MPSVLVVDDHPDTCALLVRLLRAAGYPATCVTDGAAALASVASERPAMLILDVTMPGMDGLAVLQAIRADPTPPRVPVVMYSAVADPATVARAAGLGADDYLVKGRGGSEELRALVAWYLGPPPPPAGKVT